MICNVEKMSFVAFARMTVVGLAAINFSWSQSAHAQDVTCHKNNASRRVHVVIENTDRELPCEVIFWSQSEERRRLWHAEFERGFCTEKLQETVALLTDDQWMCRPTDPPHNELRQRKWQPTM
jgi:histidine ammonia-lyase